ncbi:MAG: hypothetical protein H6Q00_776 [Holophagaceae bacterium]|nr:hypothetical protein [Holophagaceae bacterium]
MSDLPFLAGYPEHLLIQVRELIAAEGLGKLLENRYGNKRHPIQSDKALQSYVMDLKTRYMKNAPPLAGVSYDSTIGLTHNALGLQTSASRVQGARLKAKAHIRIATLFQDAPEPFLRMIAVHELAHLREKAHDKAFYQLCCHMEPHYHQLEFDLRLYLTHLQRTA